MLSTKQFSGQDISSFGVVLVNLGTPAALTKKAIKQYLYAFLSDPRVVDKPFWLWWWILRGIILPFRAPRLIHSYRAIWEEEGSPLRVISQKQRNALEKCLIYKLNAKVPVELAMNYGEPSLNRALENLQQKNINQIIILPLYPQYSSTTVAATFDGIARFYQKKIVIPELHFVSGYHTHPLYIKALSDSIRREWQKNNKANYLVFSFHGIPESYFKKGDHYPKFCKETAELVAKELGLSRENWIVAFQSRFGPQQWVQPYTMELLSSLPQQNIRQVDIISPGFSADCLETLEELATLNKNVFLQAGGTEYNYIPALNDGEMHMQLLSQLVIERCQGWIN